MLINPVLFFDEIGLAEISSNNPLKILHSYLEYDANQELEKKIAFVGVSNLSFKHYIQTICGYLS